MKSKKNKKDKKISVVDLFCGIGGLTHGFIQEDFKVVAGLDFDGSCKYAYEANNNTKFIQADLRKYSPNKVKKLFHPDSVKVLIGCAPCQAFSTYTQGNRKNDKWKLLYSFGEIISEVKPDIVSMENVSNLLNYNKGIVFCDFLSVLYANDYEVVFDVVDAKDYGVPQRRKRLILIASKIGKVNLPRKTHYKNKLITVRKAIENLPEITHGEAYKKDKLHRSRALSSLNFKRIKATPEGGGWKNWKESLVLDCHKKDSGKSYGSVYGRMKWDEVAPTLTTQCTGYGNGRYGHPTQDRAISLREAAILQSFPKKYQFFDPKEEFYPSLIEQHIGNAVPVKLGKAIARTIKSHIYNYK